MAPDDKEDSRGEDSMLDTSETTRATQKVDLDLDDAPFLEEEEEVTEEPKAPKEPASLGEDTPAPPARDKKKLIILGAVALLLLLAAGFGVKFYFFKGKAALPPEPAPHAETAEQNGTESTVPEVAESMYRLEPFWVEQKTSNDEVRFLIVRILLGAKDPGAVKDLESKILPARNAVFYYLKNKDVQFLADEENAEKLKKELLLVINQYVSDTKFETLLFEEYVVK
jgi:flagellar protein FliL